VVSRSQGRSGRRRRQRNALPSVRRTRSRSPPIRRLWRIKRGERVAAVEILRANSEQRISGTATGHRHILIPVTPTRTACGRKREASEWQRSKFCEQISEQRISGTATGHRHILIPVTAPYRKEFRVPQQDTGIAPLWGAFSFHCYHVPSMLY